MLCCKMQLLEFGRTLWSFHCTGTKESRMSEIVTKMWDEFKSKVSHGNTIIDIGHQMGVIPLGKPGPCRWEPGPKSLRQLLFSQKSNLKVHTPPPHQKKRHLHISRKSWRALDKYIHTSHHCSTHGSLYQHDRRHRETLTERIGHSHLLFPPRGPLTRTQHRRPIKGVENGPSYQNTQIWVGPYSLECMYKWHTVKLKGLGERVTRRKRWH